MGWAALFQAIAKAVTNTVSTLSYISESKKQASEIASQAQAQADERARQSKKMMQQQKTSFLKSGVYFNDGSAKAVIDETYDTAMRDINDINKDSITNQKKLIRSSKIAGLTYLLDPVGNDGSNYANNIYQGFAKTNSNTNSNSALFQNKKTIKTSGGVYGDNTLFA